MDSRPIRSVLIVGGGTAGWLTAAILARRHQNTDAEAIRISLIEAPDIPIIGVGEGTWPSMRTTLRSAGIKEADFLRQCHASFKQGSKFVGWKTGNSGDFYYHPFELPHGFYEGNLAQHWVDTEPSESFSKYACVQEYLCELDLSPKLQTTSEYSGVANYGYHLDAGQFSTFLTRHCVENLGVRHVRDKVIDVVADGGGDIESVLTEQSGPLHADLFIDCSGFRSLLLGQHFGIGYIDKRDTFPINSALAVQVPYSHEAPIRSATIATAQTAGWIWDIGLANRRGVGYVFSDNHVTPEKASDQLQRYLGLGDADFETLSPRRLAIEPGYRKEFWHRNCVAVGLSAGFLEPLEASAMMLIEASANMIANQMPATRGAMDIVARRFNRRVHYRWQRIIDFLKLHYVLSDRQEPFWRDAAQTAGTSDRLQEDLELWRFQAPWKADFDSLEEAFPVGSYQYVLYGMGFHTCASPTSATHASMEFVRQAAGTVRNNAQLLTGKVLSNRDMLRLVQSA